MLVMNGDSYCDVRLNQFVNFHKESENQVSLIINYQADVGRYGSIEIDKTNIKKFKEKSGIREPGWINAGIYLIPVAFIETIGDGEVSLEADIFPQWVANGINAYRKRKDYNLGGSVFIRNTIFCVFI